MTITAKELADKLGLSPSAVSLALNDKPGVSEKTRSMVKEAASQYGFTQRSGRKKEPDAVVRSIRYVIFLDSGMAVKETSFYSFVLRGIEETAKQEGYNVLVSYFNADDDWTVQTEAMEQDTSGIIILATELQEEHVKKLVANSAVRRLWERIPVVLVDNATDCVDLDSVQSDNYRGARLAANYLFSRGFKDVGYLRSTTRISCFDKRCDGLMAARLQHGISKDTPLQIINVGSSSDQAFQDMDRYLDLGGKVCPAYFADNDIIAAACIRAMKNHGYRVPEDVSVVGFDDMPLCTLFEPPLTTIGVKKTTIGRFAADLLLQRIKAGQAALGPKAPDANVRMILSARLVLRESVR